VIGFACIKDQQQPIRILTAFSRAGKIPHAMLFTGSDGVGKRTTALAFAMVCNCTGNRVSTGLNPGDDACAEAGADEMAGLPMACGQCRSCKKIQADSHPDVIRIAPVGQFVRIAQIRELLHILAMKPYEASWRVVIISDAHAMNSEAGNALLKVLEEPPDRTILILTARGTADLLPTIVSRCRRIRFNPLSRQSLAALLIENQALPADTANALAAMADGSYGRALRFYRQNWSDTRRWLIDAGGFLEVTPSTKRSISVLMALALRLVENKHKLMDAMDMLTILYRDLAVCGFRRGAIMNEDLASRIQRAAEHMNETDILLHMEAIETARKHIQANANARLTVERLLMRLAGHLPAAARAIGSA
jgi:DNA polymerase-3 subunit delta'